MQNDSSQMKYIALLTMVFLPISTMAVRKPLPWLSLSLYEKFINKTLTSRVLVHLLHHSLLLGRGPGRARRVAVLLGICSHLAGPHHPCGRCLGGGDALCEAKARVGQDGGH